MKAKLYNIIQTLVDINADFDHRDRIIPKGTEARSLKAFRTAISFRFFAWLTANRDVFASHKASLGLIFL
jgi:hypothetical protein